MIDTVEEGSIKGFSDVELINELERRGFIVKDDDDYENPHDELFTDLGRLYLDYMTVGGAFFNKQLKLFFNRWLNKTLK